MSKICVMSFLMSLYIICGQNVYGQIVLEAEYDSASSNLMGSLLIVNLEVEGEKYVRIVRSTTERKMDFYNLDHSIWKTIQCTNFPMDSVSGQPLPYNTIMYITQHLFNLDDKIEFLYLSTYWTYCRVYNESGEVEYNFDGQAPIVAATIPPQQYPVYNTSQGSKLIMSSMLSDEAYVYSLPGTLPVYLEQPASVDELKLSAFPNPSYGTTTIEYQLPANISQGQIMVRSVNGIVVKNYTVDHSFHNLVLNHNQLPAGTYIISLFAGNARRWEKQVIVD
jgi:hypothetical protein